jgi:membrane protein
MPYPPPRRWNAIFAGALREYNADHLSIVAAGIAFHILLAVLPAMAAFVAIYGLVGQIKDLSPQLAMLSIFLPAAVVKAIGIEMVRIASVKSGLSAAAIAGSSVALWSANGATRAMFTGLNIAYETAERRGFVWLTLASGAFTIGLLVMLVLATIGFGAGSVVGALFGPRARMLFEVVRWPILVLLFAGGLSLLYRFGTSPRGARWRWLDWGTASATLAWLAASAVLTFYIGRFATYERTYGSLGDSIGVLLWLWISAAIILAGAELNCEIERRRHADVGRMAKGHGERPDAPTVNPFPGVGVSTAGGEPT